MFELTSWGGIKHTPIKKENDMKNQIIKIKNAKHGRKVIKYFQSKGVDTKDFKGNNLSYPYYGVIDGCFDNFKESAIQTKVEQGVVEVIKLPKKKKFPREMYVWDDNMEDAHISTVYAKIPGVQYKYIAYSHKNDDDPATWENAMDVKKFEKVESITVKQAEELIENFLGKPVIIKR